ncbi:nickel-dependent hydrogenase large subunit, partial [Campylobacter sp. MOP51]
MEKLAENRMNYDQMGYLAERVCGICGYAHAIACIEAAEKAIRLEIPLRAQAIRVICLEIERLHSHLLNIGLACEVTG